MDLLILKIRSLSAPFLATDFNTYTGRSMTAYGNAIDDGTASACSCVRSMFRGVYVRASVLVHGTGPN